MTSLQSVRAVRLVPVETPVSAVARIPGSKSITNRALVIAALADGESELTGALASDDTIYMAEAWRALGLQVEHDREAERFWLRGGNGSFPATEAEIFVGNSGTSMRFLVAALTLGHGRYRIDGVPRMRQRPIGPLLDALRGLGATVTSETGNACPPVIVEASGLPGGRTSMLGDQSSQYFSALLMAAPYATQGVTIEIVGDLVSKPYMPMTAAVMRDFGVEVELDEVNWASFSVVPGQKYTGRQFQIEPDASNASYFFAVAAVTSGTITVDGLGYESTQGDLQFVRALEQMGARVEMSAMSTTVRGPEKGQLRGVTIDMNAISDTAQTLAAIAPFAEG
ncbi:MAG: 3-phosphoshikimate 1-carboxyvinyltransferase, partial [Thermomicrobiales bacterium]